MSDSETIPRAIERARQAVSGLDLVLPEDAENDEWAVLIQDTVTDLMHLAVAVDADWEHILFLARVNFEAEQNGE